MASVLCMPCPMSEPIVPSAITVNAANKLLKSFDCTNPRSENDISVLTLREALLTLNRHADYHIFGICADNVHQGCNTLRQYGQALGDDIDIECPAWDGPVYIKYNTKTSLFHVDNYAGSHRGVLVSFQSAYDHGINDLYGHFPLNLFEPDQTIERKRVAT